MHKNIVGIRAAAWKRPVKGLMPRPPCVHGVVDQVVGHYALVPPVPFDWILPGAWWIPASADDGDDVLNGSVEDGPEAFS